MFDCCIVNHELDLLEIRWNTINDVVEKFVVVESDTTHSGKEKRLWFTENKHQERFKKFEDKVIHLVFKGARFTSDQDGDNTHMAWYNENAQRNYILEALKIAQPSDGILYIADVDEIPKPEKLLEGREIYNRTGLLVNFALEQCMYYLNYNFKGFKQIRGSMMYNEQRAKEIYAQYGRHQYGPSDTRWHMVADGYENDWPNVHDAGWHFSTLMDPDSIRYKIESNAHRFCDTEEYKNYQRIQECIEKGIHVYDMERYKGTKLQKRELSFLPKYVQENLDRFRKYII